MTGKTTAADTLAQSLTLLHEHGVQAQHEAHKRFFNSAKLHVLNPKSITMGEMYGDVNKITREWQDGVLSSCVRGLVKLTGPERHWVTFDGPVDAIWVENLNTVLDDNKILTLASNERIAAMQMQNKMYKM
jgi:dynein heavy chain